MKKKNSKTKPELKAARKTNSGGSKHPHEKKQLVPGEPRHGKFYYLVGDFIFWVIGSALYAVSVDCFTAPNNIAPGGVTGLSTLINYVTGFPIGVGIILINIPIFAVAFKIFGLKFIIRTVIGTALTSVFIDLGTAFSLLPQYTGDRLLAALFGGAFSGLGLGLIFLRGATSGGTDILGRLLKLKFPHLSLGTLIMVMDFCVVLISGFVYKSIESMLYACIVFFVSSKAVDFVVYGAAKSKMLMIVTKHPETTPKRIIDELGRGVTVFPVQGAYTGEEKKMLMTVVRLHEVAKVTRIIRECDPEAFVIVTDASEVLGKGFKTDEKEL